MQQSGVSRCVECQEWPCQCYARRRVFPDPFYHGYRCTRWHEMPDPCNEELPVVNPAAEPLEEIPPPHRLPPIEVPPDVSIEGNSDPIG